MRAGVGFCGGGCRGEVACCGVGWWWWVVRSADVKPTTSRSEARAALLKAQAAAAEERKRREVANVGDLTTFVVETAKLDGVGEWERSRLEKVRSDAEARRERHRAAAGRALQAMRLRGESIASIAQQAGVSVAAVRGFLQAAAKAAPTSADDGEAGGEREVAAAAASDGAVAPVGRAPEGSSQNPT